MRVLGTFYLLYKSSLLITYALHVPEREIEEAQHGEGKKPDEERASVMVYAFQVTCIVLCYLYQTYLTLPGCPFGMSIHQEYTSNKASNLESKKTT